MFDGNLGTSLLSDFVITFNYPDNRIELTPAPLGKPTEILQAWYFTNLLIVSLDLNGRQGNFIVDTGAVTSVLSHSMAARLGVTEDTPDARVDNTIAGVGGTQSAVLVVPNVTIKSANLSESYPRIMAIDLRPISRMIGTEISGVLGTDFFEDFTLSLDYFGTAVRFYAGSDSSGTFSSLGVGISESSSEWRAASAQNSPPKLGGVAAPIH
jgi:hypothetical protein